MTKKRQEDKTVEITRFPEEKSFELVKKYRIPVAKHGFAKNEKQLEDVLKKIKYPCVLKASGKKIIHKTDIGGVLFAENHDEAVKAFKKLIKMQNAEAVIVQEKLDGVEFIVGGKTDPQFGAVVIFGIGGIYAEVIKDVSFRICPVNEKSAEEMIKELKGFEAITKRTPVKIASISKIISNVCSLITKEKIKEMDINPLICNKDSCVAVDVRIIK